MHGRMESSVQMAQSNMLNPISNLLAKQVVHDVRERITFGFSVKKEISSKEADMATAKKKQVTNAPSNLKQYAVTQLRPLISLLCLRKKMKRILLYAHNLPIKRPK